MVVPLAAPFFVASSSTTLGEETQPSWVESARAGGGGARWRRRAEQVWRSNHLPAPPTSEFRLCWCGDGHCNLGSWNAVQRLQLKLCPSGWDTTDARTEQAMRRIGGWRYRKNQGHARRYATGSRRAEGGEYRDEYKRRAMAQNRARPWSHMARRPRRFSRGIAPLEKLDQYATRASAHGRSKMPLLMANQTAGNVGIAAAPEVAY